MKKRKPARARRSAAGGSAAGSRVVDESPVVLMPDQRAVPGRPKVVYKFKDCSKVEVDALYVLATERDQLARLLAATESEKSERQRKAASAPRKPQVSAENLALHRDAYKKKNGTTRGWLKAAVIEFSVSAPTIRARIGKQRG